MSIYSRRRSTPVLHLPWRSELPCMPRRIGTLIRRPLVVVLIGDVLLWVRVISRLRGGWRGGGIARLEASRCLIIACRREPIDHKRLRRGRSTTGTLSWHHGLRVDLVGPPSERRAMWTSRGLHVGWWTLRTCARHEGARCASTKGGRIWKLNKKDGHDLSFCKIRLNMITFVLLMPSFFASDVPSSINKLPTFLQRKSLISLTSPWSWCTINLHTTCPVPSFLLGFLFCHHLLLVVRVIQAFRWDLFIKDVGGITSFAEQALRLDV